MSDMPPGSVAYEQPAEDRPVTKSWLAKTVEWFKEKRILIGSSVVASACAAIAVIGQVSYYLTIPNLPTVIAYLFPMGIEAISWVFGAAAAYCVQKDLPSAKYSRRMWGFALIAAAVNTWHGVLHINPSVGIVLGSASVFGPFVWHSYTGMARIERSGKTFEEIKVEAKTRLLHPILSFHVSRIQSLLQCDRATAWKWALAFTMEEVKKKAKDEQAKKLEKASLPVMTIEKTAASDKQQVVKKSPAKPAVPASRPELPAARTERPAEPAPDVPVDISLVRQYGDKRAKAIAQWLARIDERDGKGPSLRSIDVAISGSYTGTAKNAVGAYIKDHGDPRRKSNQQAAEGVAR